jgi:hypothetical protein
MEELSSNAPRMKMHPIYRRPPKKNDLFQGDIINSESLVATGALDGHQDYFAGRKDFKAFCVMTQTCDLVCDRSAEYISLAVVRSIANVFGPDDVKNGDRIKSTRKLLENIVEHQQNRRDYFFLPALSKAAIDEDSVVDLRVTFSLHNQHYKEIRKARRMGMNPLYAACLGWMAGNVYFRIAMPPWNELKQSDPLDQRTARLLEDIKARGINRSTIETASHKPKSVRRRPLVAGAGNPLPRSSPVPS